MLMLTPAELRERRLLALGEQNSFSTAPPPQTTSSPTPDPPRKVQKVEPLSDPVDPDLAEALKMSMQNNNATSEFPTSVGYNNNNDDDKMSIQSDNDTSEPPGLISGGYNNNNDDDTFDADLQAALTLSAASNTNCESELEKALALSMQNQPQSHIQSQEQQQIQIQSDLQTLNNRDKFNSPLPTPPRPDFVDIDMFETLMWSADSTEEDKARWFSQSISTSATPHHGWGLEQTAGGPCGILAVLQCYILQHIIRTNEIDRATYDYTGGNINTAIAAAIGNVLARAAVQGIVKNTTVNCGVRLVWETDGLNFVDVGMEEESESGLSLAVSTFLLNDVVGQGVLAQFQGVGGIVKFARSLIETRTPNRINEDFDSPAPDTTLTARFGHCQGELLNLCLSGCASSNMFDGVMDLGGMIMKGVPEQSVIGHLSQLEALRMCEVGSFHKSPSSPLWIIGSESHYSVLFALDNKSITESSSDQLLKRCRRAFRMIDCENQGFVQMTDLRTLLLALDMTESCGGDEGCIKLANALETGGTGIILWDDFWKAASRLLMGSSVEVILDDLKAAAAAESVTSQALVVVEERGGGSESESGSGSGTENFTPIHTPSLEVHADSFDILHFNGLRGGTTTQFSITRMSAEDAVGASVALSTGGGAGGGGGSSSASKPLEEICRTRWPSAKFSWAAGAPPSID